MGAKRFGVFDGRQEEGRISSRLSVKLLQNIVEG